MKWGEVLTNVVRINYHHNKVNYFKELRALHG